MAVDFPSSPSLNDTYTSGGRTWKWNGTGWIVQPVVLTLGAVTAALGYTPLPDDNATVNGGSY